MILWFIRRKNQLRKLRLLPKKLQAVKDPVLFLAFPILQLFPTGWWGIGGWMTAELMPRVKVPPIHQATLVQELFMETTASVTMEPVWIVRLVVNSAQVATWMA